MIIDKSTTIPDTDEELDDPYIHIISTEEFVETVERADLEEKVDLEEKADLVSPNEE